MSDHENGKGVSRRTLLGTTAAAAGVGLAGGVALNISDCRRADQGRGAEGAGRAACGAAEGRSGTPANSTNTTPSSPAASPANCASSACRRCAN